MARSKQTRKSLAKRKVSAEDNAPNKSPCLETLPLPLCKRMSKAGSRFAADPRREICKMQSAAVALTEAAISDLARATTPDARAPLTLLVELRREQESTLIAMAKRIYGPPRSPDYEPFQGQGTA